MHRLSACRMFASMLVLISPFSVHSFNGNRASSDKVSLGKSHLAKPEGRVIYYPRRQIRCVENSFCGSGRRQTFLLMGQISEQEAKKAIDTVVNALRRDKNALTELGRLEKVTAVLGYGSPKNGVVAVRFNASFKKGGFGRASVPLPFGLGQSNVSEGRGQMVAQVKSSLDEDSGKLLDCSVFRDLGYGRAFNLKV